MQDRVTLSAGVKFCHVNVSRWGNPSSRVGIVILNSRKIHFGGSFASLLKVTIESHGTEGTARAASECRRTLIAKKRGLPAFFLFTCLGHSIILRKCTPGWRGCKIAPSCKQALNRLEPHMHLSHDLVFKIWQNNWTEATLRVFLSLIMSYSYPILNECLLLLLLGRPKVGNH